MPITAEDYLVRTVMSSVSGLPADRIVNDWAFTWEGGPAAPIEADFADLTAAVGDFFRAGALQQDRVGTYIGRSVDRAATHLIEVFSLLTGGSAVYSTPWLGPTAAEVGPIALPTEVAACLSFHADLFGVPEEVGATRPQARRKGRVYIGPLQTNAITQDDQPLLSPAFSLALRANANVMHDSALAANWRWCVWSRADDTLREVVGGWTDNALDTQRRRGNEASSRVTFTV